jgi:hypothetical protein
MLYVLLSDIILFMLCCYTICYAAIGMVTIPVSDVIRASSGGGSGAVEQEYQLDVSYATSGASKGGSGSQEVFLKCRLEWASAMDDF